MELLEKKEALIDIFKDDPLWRHINTLGKQDEVFSNVSFLQDMIIGVDYTTSQVVSLLDLKNNQQVLNLLNRHDLKEYIQVTQSANGYYSFNHVAIFQLRMMLVLREHNVQPLELAQIIGTITQYSRGTKIKRDIIDEDRVELENELVDMAVIRMSEMFELNLQKLMENQLKNEATILEVKQSSITSQLELIESQLVLIDNQQKVKPGMLSRMLGLYNEARDNELTQLKGSLVEKKEALLKENDVLEVEVGKSLLAQIELKDLENTDTVKKENQ